MTSPRKSPASELPGLDMIGVAGAPEATLQALLGRFQEADLTGARLILLTDRQGERSVARYAALIDRPGGPRVLSAPAFGPHFGAGGTAALLELAEWAQHHNLPLRETVLGGPQFNRLADGPDPAELLQLIAASNPSDIGIYTTGKNVQAGL